MKSSSSLIVLMASGIGNTWIVMYRGDNKVSSFVLASTSQNITLDRSFDLITVWKSELPDTIGKLTEKLLLILIAVLRVAIYDLSDSSSLFLKVLATTLDRRYSTGVFNVKPTDSSTTSCFTSIVLVIPDYTNPKHPDRRPYHRESHTQPGKTELLNIVAGL